MGKEEAKAKTLKKKYPLHYAVFENDLESLQEQLQNGGMERIDERDVHGNTPAMLATILGHTQCAELLLEKGADANAQSSDLWTMSHEAVSLGDPEFLTKVLKHRDYQRVARATESLLELKESLKNSDDFYVEMSWEFTSWLPVVKNYCPSDTYKVYKSDSSIRIDATLLGYEDGGAWKRGNQSFIFRFNDHSVEVVFVDHGQRAAYIQNIDLTTKPELESFNPPEEVVADKLCSPITTTGVNIESVDFERSRSFGIFSFLSSEKEEMVEGFNCRVFNASNLKVITKTRAEHLSDADKYKNTTEFGGSKPVSILMGFFEKRKTTSKNDNSVPNGQISPAEYLAESSRDNRPPIGRAREEVERQNSFNASLWLANDYPLKLEQVFPIIDLMAIRNANFSRLKSFIQLQLPSGFPVRISIPLFHMINARITFRNVNSPQEDTSLVRKDDEVGLLIDPSVFDVPTGFAQYSTTSSLLFDQAEPSFNTSSSSATAHNPQRYGAVDVDDEYVYLLERFMTDDGDEMYNRQLQSAIEQSINGTDVPLPGPNTAEPETEDDIARAIRLSQIEEEQRRRAREAEDEEIRLALELSKMEQ